MRKRNYIAAILAVVMAFQMPLMAFAEDGAGQYEQEPITYGDVTITDEGWKPDPEEDNTAYGVTSWEEGQVINVGNVTSTVSSDKEDINGNTGIPAVGVINGGTVQVNGNVSSENTQAILSVENGTVNVTGSVTSGIEDGWAVYVGDGAAVDIGGNVANVGNGKGISEGYEYGTSDGIEVKGQSTVKVGGDVTTESGDGIAVNAFEGSDKGKVEIGGSVSSRYTAITTNSASDITVGGNVAGSTGITIRTDGSGGTIEVLGAVKSTEDYSSVMIIETDITDKEALAAALPTIVVGSIEGADGSPDEYLWINILDEDYDYDNEWELYEKVYEQFLYYIAQDKFTNAILSVTGASEYKNGYVSNEGTSLTVTIIAADGYEVSAVSGTDVVKNADGTYTVVVQRGKGIDINAVISAVMGAQEEAVVNKVQGSSGTDGIASQSGTATKNQSTKNQSPVIVTPAYAIAQKQFMTAIAAQQKTLTAGGTLIIDMTDSAMKDCISFNKKTFEVLSQRKDVDIKVIYTWKGKKYAVVIPAGYDILSLLDSNGYCGCLYLNSIFGSTELTK